ncbi:WXG100 family type VII secretion target [Saccharopolyspora sp. NPDC049426]|uniref:WXG100 family type VII secretion target n=1 Tax=Saccharopolyspora sp. NPDC049426 TaxID=3155652 RepID=UPI0034470C83
MSVDLSLPLGSAGTVRFVADVRSTNDAVRGGGWDSGSYGSAGEPAGGTGDPLSALAGSGFGFLADLVPFLGEPLQQLAGDPGAVASSAQSLRDTGRGVASISDSYGQAAGPETSGWSGAAATEYLKTAAELVGGLQGIGEASTGLGEALAGMGDAVVKTAHEVTILVNEAVGRIVVIMNQAIAAAQATFGASIAAAIPQVVQIATECGVRISGHMGNLLNSAQGLLGHVDEVMKVVGAIGGVVSKIADQAEQVTAGSTAPSGSAAAGSVPTGGAGSSSSPGLTSAASMPGGAGAAQMTPSPGGAAQAGPVPGISVAGGANPATAGISPGGAGGFMPPITPQRKQQQDSDAERTSSLSARLSGELDLPERDDSRYGPRQPDGHR